MERRKFLGSVGAASAIGLAGCADSELSGTGCAQPDGDNLEASLPESSDYEMQGEPITGSGKQDDSADETVGEPTTSSGEQDTIESTISAAYSDTDGEQLVFSIVEFSSPDTASEEADSLSEEVGNLEGVIGYIVTEKYVFSAFGPDESTVTSFMKTSSTLDDGCVDNNIEFVRGSTSETPATQEQPTESDAPSGSITFTDQTTDGSYVNIERVETDGEAIIQIYDSQEEFLANPRIRFEPGEAREDIRIELSEPLSGDEELSAQMFWCKESGPDTCNGPSIATANATITVK